MKISRHKILTFVIKLIQCLGPKQVSVLGRDFAVSGQVFNPKLFFTSRLMAENLALRPNDEVLDLGTGSGVLAVLAAAKAKRVVAVDVNPEAVKAARANLARHGLEKKAEVREGDLFSCLSPVEKFDVILFNPPYLSGERKTPFDWALNDPGKAVIGRFLKEAGGHLKPGGYLLVLYSTIADEKKFLALAEESGWYWQVAAEQKSVFEKFFIYRLTIA